MKSNDKTLTGREWWLELFYWDPNKAKSFNVCRVPHALYLAPIKLVLVIAYYFIEFGLKALAILGRILLTIMLTLSWMTAQVILISLYWKYMSFESLVESLGNALTGKWSFDNCITNSKNLKMEYFCGLRVRNILVTAIVFVCAMCFGNFTFSVYPKESVAIKVAPMIFAILFTVTTFFLMDTDNPTIKNAKLGMLPYLYSSAKKIFESKPKDSKVVGAEAVKKGSSFRLREVLKIYLKGLKEKFCYEIPIKRDPY